MGDVHRRPCPCCHPCLSLFSPSWASIRLGGDIRVIRSPSETQHLAEAAWLTGAGLYPTWATQASYPRPSTAGTYTSASCVMLPDAAAVLPMLPRCCRCSPVRRMSGAIISILWELVRKAEDEPHPTPTHQTYWIGICVLNKIPRWPSGTGKLFWFSPWRYLAKGDQPRQTLSHPKDLFLGSP